MEKEINVCNTITVFRLTKAKIFWSNGHVTTINSHFGETVDNFNQRLIKIYANLNVKVLLCDPDGEGYYIK